MKLSKLHLVEYRKPFKVGFHSPQIHRRSAESVLLQLTFADGCRGYGECAPRPYVTGESCRSVIDTIARLAAPILFANAFASLEDLVTILGAVEGRCRSGPKQPYLSALTAVELALLDALGQATHAHVGELIGRPPGHTVKRSISIPFLPMDHIKALFGRLQHIISIDAVKILMKSDLEENVQRVAFVRSMIGSDMPIRIEANGKWSFPEALAHIDKLAPYGVVSIEEPIREARPDRLAQLREKSAIEVILDESVCTMKDAGKMIASQACDGFNLKLSKCGGLLKLMAMADLAQRHDMKCQLGTHVGEGPVLDAAGFYAASSHTVFYNYEGYSSLLFLDLSHDIEQLGRLIAPPVLRGHGLGIDPEGLAALFDSPDAIEVAP